MSDTDLNKWALLDSYDWRTSATTENIDLTHYDEERNFTELSETGVRRLAKAGFYSMHLRKNDDDIQKAARLLLKAFHVIADDKGVIYKNMKNDESYYHLINNLAYTLVTCRGKINAPAQAKNNFAFGLLEVIFYSEKASPEAKAFAHRIIGQQKFAESQKENNFASKEELVQEGCKRCLNQGLADLSVENPNHVTEIARTYNRNASEILSLLPSAPPQTKARLILQAYDYALDAEAIWTQHTKKEDYPTFKERNQEKINEIKRIAKELVVLLPPPFISTQKIASPPTSFNLTLT